MEMNGETMIHRSIEEVAEYVLDVNNDANWRYGIEEKYFQTEFTDH